MALSQDFRLKLDASHDPVQKILSDSDWNSPAFLQRHQEILSSNYISEIFCRIAYVETDFFKLKTRPSLMALWSPRQHYVKIALSDYKCTICQEHFFQNKFCLVENHPCMTYLPPQTAINCLQDLLK